MTHQTIRVNLDNNVQSGDISLTQLQTAIGTELGQTPGLIDINRDANGKLISLSIRMPDTLADDAKDVIADNAGVANAFFCPEQLMWSALNDTTPDGLTYDATLLSPRRHVISAWKILEGGPLGELANTGSGNTYTDGYEALNPGAAAVLFYNFDTSAAWTIPTTATLTFNITASNAVVMQLTNDLVIPATVPNTSENYVRCWLDVNGSVYLRDRRVGGVQYPAISYEDACEAGAL